MKKFQTSLVVTVAAGAIAGAIFVSCLRPPSARPGAGNVAVAPPATSEAKTSVARTVPGLPTSYAWMSSAPVIVPHSDAKHDLVAVKDPTVIRFNGLWHVYASSVGRGGIYGMVYTSFADWADAPNAPMYTMDKTPGFNTYVAAPQLFYFEPQKLWYLVFQSGPPMFSTNANPGDPKKWTSPQSLYPKTPTVIEENGGWLDFWVICDAKDCHLFFSNDHGRWYKSKTSIEKFPRGFGEPVVAMEDAEAGRLFEACNVYKIKGQNQYLALVEAFDKTSDHRRYFRSWTADSLEGPWIGLHNDGASPFAGKQNVTFQGEPWSDDISHGEMIRAGYDQTMEIDGAKPLQFLYQGFLPGSDTSDYNGIPWRLGLLTLK
jgi:endo-1,4-beta-xylanase